MRLPVVMTREEVKAVLTNLTIMSGSVTTKDENRVAEGS